MKLESLKGSKFEAFKGNEIQNPLKVVGGFRDTTHWRDFNGGSGGDTFDYGPDQTTANRINDQAGDIIFNQHAPETDHYDIWDDGPVG